MASLLDQATRSAEAKRYMKCLIYGREGIGKTITAFHLAKEFDLNLFGLDCESALSVEADEAKGWPEFSYMTTEDPHAALQILEELAQDPKGFNFLIVDPISTLWRGSQADAEEDNRRKLDRDGKSVGRYDTAMTIATWGPLKSVAHRISRCLRRIQMPLIVTAREANAWKDNRISGVKPDATEGFAHEFDVVIHATRNSDKGPRRARVLKDRWNRLPETFEGEPDNGLFIGQMLAKTYADKLTAKVEARPRADDDTVRELMETQDILGIPQSAVVRRLREMYRVDRYDDLTPEQAAEVLSKYQDAATKKEEADA